MQYSIFVDRLINPGRDPDIGVRITIVDGNIVSIRRGVVSEAGDVVFHNSTCSPGLINAHDHLKYTWIKRIGGGHYSNSYEWLPTLYRDAREAFLSKIKISDLYWFGTYKTLFAGATTVANHCRTLGREFFLEYPIRILHDFRREIFVRDDIRAHSMGGGTEEEAKLARKYKLPFVVHVAEGLDAIAAEEVDILERCGGLFDGAVLVHALNVTDRQIDSIARAGASIVWCPASNRYLFGQTAPVAKFLAAGINVALGTDSTCTGSSDLLNEMRIAVKELGGSIAEAARVVHELCTTNAAKAYHDRNLGEVRAGKRADLLIFETASDDPFVDLIELGPSKIYTLLRDGNFLLKRRSLELPARCVAPRWSNIEIGDLTYEVAGDPEGLLRRAAAATGMARTDFPLGQIFTPGRP